MCIWIFPNHFDPPAFSNQLCKPSQISLGNGLVSLNQSEFVDDFPCFLSFSVSHNGSQLTHQGSCGLFACLPSHRRVKKKTFELRTNSCGALSEYQATWNLLRPMWGTSKSLSPVILCITFMTKAERTCCHQSYIPHMQSWWTSKTCRRAWTLWWAMEHTDVGHGWAGGQ